MGSTIRDFAPQFILFGVDDENAAIKAQNFIKQYNSTIKQLSKMLS